MDLGRRAKIIEAVALAGEPEIVNYPIRVCSAGATLVGAAGVGLALVIKNHFGAVWAANQFVGDLEDLQFSLGEGPGTEASQTQAAVVEPCLQESTSRWPFFREPALSLGLRAVFAFPLITGQTCFGVLTFYRDIAGALSPDEMADASELTTLAAQDLVTLHAQGAVQWLLSHGTKERACVYQACGMVSAQITSDMATAMARLRAYSFAHDATLFETAGQVVTRHLRLTR